MKIGESCRKSIEEGVEAMGQGCSVGPLGFGQREDFDERGKLRCISTCSITSHKTAHLPLKPCKSIDGHGVGLDQLVMEGVADFGHLSTGSESAFGMGIDYGTYIE